MPGEATHGVMDERLIQVQVMAARAAFGQMTGRHMKALSDSVEQACRARGGLQRAGRRHRRMSLAPVLSSDAGFAYSLMLMAGRASDGMIVSSRRRLLACLRPGTTARRWRWKST